MLPAPLLIALQSPEAEKAAAKFKLPEGFGVALAAAEPQLANPVAFWVDPRGRFYVAETYRQEFDGVPDNRTFPEWTVDDLAAQTVADRRAFYLKHHPEVEEEWTDREDRIKLLWDGDGDGLAESSTVFAGGFDDLLDGTGAGVLARGHEVYYTCIPHLWRLTDADGDGAAERREALHGGYGVRVALRGHDLHGLIFGPDGRLYYSIGDRGYNVQTEDGRRLADPGRGAVFRCDPDGSGLEVFYYGLRNPQELAFNDFGDLFTVDNNSDAGDRARLVYLMEGGDSGWHMSYQYVPDRGPWMPERWWEPRHAGQAEFLNAPLANLCSGPSGLVHYPGTGFGERFRDTFFVCDFLGGATWSGVRSFQVAADGAGYRFTRSEDFLTGVLCTDVDFGADGAMYVLDWVDGWTGVNQGRVWRVRGPEDPRAAETRALLAGDFAALSPPELEVLLHHADRRVRQEAQFALAARGQEALELLAASARHCAQPLARLHAIWAIGQIGRRAPHALERLRPLLAHADAETRAQAAKMLGEGPYAPALAELSAALRDPAPRVRYFAALALGKIGDPRAVEPLIELLRADADADRFLRHGAVQGLAGAAAGADLSRWTGDPSRAVRLGVLLAMRQRRDPRVAAFLADPEPALQAEAARAVYDTPIAAALAELAAALERSDGAGEPLLRRARAANDLLRGPAALERVARCAAAHPSAYARAEALRTLRDWAPPPPTERVLNRYWPRPEGDEDLGAALAGLLPVVLSAAPDAERALAAACAGKYQVRAAEAGLLELVRSGAHSGEARVAALRALAELSAASLADAVAAAAAAADERLRAEAIRQLARLDPEQALGVIRAAIAGGGLRERQAAILALGSMRTAAADALLAGLAQQLAAGELAPQLALETVQAVKQRAGEDAPGLRAALAAAQARFAGDDPIAAYAMCLEGGDAARGERIFFEKNEVECVRCHAIQGRGGGGAVSIGPDLGGIGARQDRRYLLESMVAPARAIAAGYESVLLDLIDAEDLVGRVLREDEQEVALLVDRAGKSEEVTVRKDRVRERFGGSSAMPNNLIDFLSREELRDLVEFLAAQTAAGPQGH